MHGSSSHGSVAHSICIHFSLSSSNLDANHRGEAQLASVLLQMAVEDSLVAVDVASSSKLNVLIA